MHRAKKAGIALDIERKLEEKYNEEDALGTPDRVIKWINEILKGEHAPCTRTGWRHLQFHLRDGIVLCKFINKLLESEEKQTVKFSKNSHTAFIAMENIEHFNKLDMVFMKLIYSRAWICMKEGKERF
ncbi:DgyrCDS4023 [Dimorphilus gyrociliatus]|uniref:DgyrCDS4023 n=1 Tax=Dimorphilus gyrociliatus TaxID=2664684 RepID=A0A7I8VFN8_9ANNE|nr:DgyrCDS4023 [Dimorphilus gyrociliatus]